MRSADQGSGDRKGFDLDLEAVANGRVAAVGQVLVVVATLSLLVVGLYVAVLTSTPTPDFDFGKALTSGLQQVAWSTYDGSPIAWRVVMSLFVFIAIFCAIAVSGAMATMMLSSMTRRPAALARANSGALISTYVFMFSLIGVVAVWAAIESKGGEAMFWAVLFILTLFGAWAGGLLHREYRNWLWVNRTPSVTFAVIAVLILSAIAGRLSFNFTVAAALGVLVVAAAAVTAARLLNAAAILRNVLGVELIGKTVDEPAGQQEVLETEIIAIIEIEPVQ